jgi:hypothetical protein
MHAFLVSYYGRCNGVVGEVVEGSMVGWKEGWYLRTHCGLGAPQSTHLLLSFVFWISSNYTHVQLALHSRFAPSCCFSHKHTLLRVSGSTSHILLMAKSTCAMDSAGKKNSWTGKVVLGVEDNLEVETARQ